MNKKNDFEFKYTAPTNSERKEIESIKNRYTKPTQQTDKLVKLRKLDSTVKNMPIIISLIIGILGTLLFGLGLTMILEWEIIVWGVILCSIALIPIILAYPIYLKVFKHLKNKHSEEIIKISEELLNEYEK